MYWGKRVAVAEVGVPGAQVIAEDPDRVPGLAANHTAMSARSDAWPVVSPDGSRIVFQASETRTNIAPGLDVGKIEGPKEGIWVVNADGSDPRQLTSYPNYLDFFPQWSADGQSIMFVRTDGKTIRQPWHARSWCPRGDLDHARKWLRREPRHDRCIADRELLWLVLLEFGPCPGIELRIDERYVTIVAIT